MKVILAIVLLVSVSALPDQKKACVDECTPPGTQHTLGTLFVLPKSCPSSRQFCYTDGCNHYCLDLSGMIKRTEAKRQECSQVMCMMFCFNGFVKGADGCPICRCA
ncbi:antistasin isoform X1 [Biomphalaria pfeifferi]|uniref:Antistasin isoform X1 n=1 Tax=Biomphalaria pfeifferi TaxID=112525 RepID=A0AAD8F2G1_BIOPF|nr:antistasin isoform X1 [Biomphalaria pfeifferi]